MILGHLADPPDSLPPDRTRYPAGGAERPGFCQSLRKHRGRAGGRADAAGRPPGRTAGPGKAAGKAAKGNRQAGKDDVSGEAAEEKV